MSHKIKCPECRAPLSMADDAPTRIKCPKCGEVFKSVDAEDADAAPRRAARSEREDDETPRRRDPKRDQGDTSDDEPRRRPERYSGRRNDEDEDEAPARKKKPAEKKKFPLWLPISIGGAAVVTTLIIILINASSNDTKKEVAGKDNNKTETPKVVPKQPFVAKSGVAKSTPPKKNVPPIDVPEFPPDPNPPPKKETEIGEPPIVVLPPKKEAPKKREDPAELIRSLDPTIEIPPLPAVDQRPVLVLNPNGHAAAVRKLMFTPDSKRMITVAMDKTIRVWEVATGETIKTIYMPNGPGDEGSLFAAALTPDGKKLAVGGWTIGEGKHGILSYLVSLETGAIERTFKGHRGAINSLSFNSNGQWLVSSSSDGTALLFKTATGELVAELKGHTKTVSMAAYHPKEARVATASHDGTARIWMTGTGKAPYPFKELSGHTADVHCVAWSRDGSQLATGSTDGTIRTWTKDGNPIRTYEKQEQKFEGQMAQYQIFALAYTPDGKELLHAGVAVKGMAGILNLASGEHRIAFHEHSNTLAGCAVSPNGILAATTGGDFNETFLWNISDGSVVQKLQGGGKAVWAVAWGLDGKTIVWGGVNRGGSFPPSRPVEHAFKIDSFEFAPLPERNISGQTDTAGYSLSRTGLNNLVVKKDGQEHFTFNDPNNQILFAATILNRQQMVVAGSNSLMLVDLDTKATIRAFRGHQANILTVAPSPVGGYFMTGSADQTIRIWKADKEDPVLTFFFADREWIAWTPEGYYCCSANGERLMGWQINQGFDKVGKFYPANQFHASLFQPEVIRNLFRVNGELRFAMALYIKERRRPLEVVNVTQVIPPDVQITSPVAQGGELKINEAAVEVKATARSTGKHPVTSMRLLVDGRPYGGAAGVLRIPNPKLGEVQRSWKVNLPKGSHTFNVLAESAVSRGMSAAVDVEQVFGDDKLPNLYVFAAGINEYPRPMRLNFASTDAQAITKVLREKTTGVFGKVEIRMLLDKEATKANIMQGLAWLESNMTANDIGVFFFSGHGTKDDDDNFYLVPVDVGRSAKTCVSGEEVKQKLANMPGRLVAMLDACHSGSAAESFQAGRADDLVRDLLDDDCGVVVICSSLGEEYSLESPATKAGFFTLGMVEGLSGRADLNKDGFVFINEACFYAAIRVKQLSRGMQNPTLGKSPNIKPFALTKS
jgi:WD40 repeat protein